jgi:3',5'-cyclic AMP phosphodiesterase CpdA
MVDSLRPAFVILTGDLVRDALRVTEEEARGYYELFTRELAEFSVPVYPVPGNHEKFGIERHRSLVSPEHPLYGNRMYRHYLGPNYYAFSFGGIRFLGLDTVDYDDQWYHGHVDDVQLAWMGAELARAPTAAPVVTFNHIPFVSGAMTRTGFQDQGLAPTTIRVGGTTHFRHTVYNQDDVLATIGERLEIALGGHIHMRESLRYRTQSGEQRLQQAAAIVGPPAGGALDREPVSGLTLYRVEDGRVDDGTFLPLDPPGR